MCFCVCACVRECTCVLVFRVWLLYMEGMCAPSQSLESLLLNSGQEWMAPAWYQFYSGFRPREECRFARQTCLGEEGQACLDMLACSKTGALWYSHLRITIFTSHAVPPDGRKLPSPFEGCVSGGGSLIVSINASVSILVYSVVKSWWKSYTYNFPPQNQLKNCIFYG